MGPDLWVHDGAFINNPITNYHTLVRLSDQQKLLGFFVFVKNLSYIKIMDTGNRKLILYLALIAGLVTMVIAGHPWWGFAFLILLFSVK
jgi:hypothetical protein